MLGFLRGPKGAALISIAIANALHFSSYEYSRSATLTLFTSPKMGFSSDAAVPAATGCISPFSVLLLWLYTRLLKKGGPRYAIRHTSLWCAVSMLLGGLVLAQNSFVQLLYSQHWAFIGSLGEKGKKSVWFAPLAGSGSVLSTMTARSVGPLLSHNSMSLAGLMILASVMILSSGFFAEYAYAMAEQTGIHPMLKKYETDDASLTTKTTKLFARLPILKVLMYEVFASQALSSLVTFLFVQEMKHALPNDADRAAWTGNVYAFINGVSGFMQFAFIPLTVSYMDPRRMWPYMPATMLILLSYMTFIMKGGISIISIAFCTLKIFEYSIRGVANEMLFASLDDESRHVAKQEIALLANRFSKSVTAVTMSLLTSFVEPMALVTTILSYKAVVSAILWWIASYQLSDLIFAKKQKTA